MGALALGTASAADCSIGHRNFDNPCSSDASQQFNAVNPQRQDTPNDPGYDLAEPDDPDSTLNGGPVTPSTNVYDEDFGLFGFPSALTRTSAVYRDGPNATACVAQGLAPPCPQISGFNASGAWKLDRGNPATTIAILDTGIRWDATELRTQIHLNKGELPIPDNARATPISDASSVPGGSCSNMAAAYDANGDGVFNVLDYVCDSRVSITNPGRHGPAGLLTAEDLINAFSNSQDDDNNGFVDDIAGWDFFDNDNNPYDASSYFAAHNHGTGRADNAAEHGNDGQGGIGVCPHCQIMPVRTWDTFVSDGNTFGMGILYATDNGVNVIEGANGSTYHSSFAEAASQYAYDHGVVQTFSGDDLNTGNHNYPANYGHAMLIQGTVPDTMGLGMDAGAQFAEGLAGLCHAGVCLGSDVPPGTFFRGANTTQYGGKSSISMEGTTGSENTGKAAGAAGLVISAYKDSGQPGVLRPDEVRGLLEQTAEPVTTLNGLGEGNPDPGAPPNASRPDQWSSHFGWGRVDLGAAVADAQAGKIPPEATIDSPDWYAPVTGDSIDITGLAQARFAGSFDWKLEWGVGQAPSSWTTAAQGSSSGSVTDLGSIDMNAVRSALQGFTPPPDSGGPTLTTSNPYKNEFTVRLTVTPQGEPAGTPPGIDRRVFTSAKDSTLRNGFPKRMGTGGEAPIRYADVNGDNVQELIVPTEDGQIHAYEQDGTELPGWPVSTMLEKSAQGHDSAPGFQQLETGGTPPREPPRAPVIADMNGDGRPEIITTAGTHLYAWEPDGQPVPGFPVSSDLSFCGPAHESQQLVHPKCGFASSPAVGNLQVAQTQPGQNVPLDIVAPSLDGHLYGFDNQGDPLPGFPVQLVDPSVPPAQQMIAEDINEPAIADLNGDGKDDVVVATNETYDPVPPSQDSCFPAGGESDLLAAAAGGSSRLYAVDGSNGSLLSGWPVDLNGAIQSTLPFIGPGQDPSIGTVGGQQTIFGSTTGSTSIEKFDPSGAQNGCIQQGVFGPGSDATDRSGVVNLFESTSIGRLDPASGPAVVKYGLSLTDLSNLLLVGQNSPYNHLIGAYNAQTGATLPAFPRVTDDFQFLSASDVARVDSALPENEVVAGTGLGLLHAYDGITGTDAPGFPKVTGGWLFAPAAFSDDGRMADITREGFLFQWNLPNLPPCQTEWPSFRHDQQDTGNYDKDGTPPSTPTALSLSGSTLSFKAPGDDNACGTATSYEAVTSSNPITPTNFAAATPLASPPAPAAAGTTQTYTLPDHQRYVAIRAIDDAGNVGWDANLDTTQPSGGGAGGGSGDGGSGGKGSPNTQIRKGRISSSRHRASFSFAGTGGTPPYSFQCSLSGRRKAGHRRRSQGFHACRSKRGYRHLKPGRYTFDVRAVDASGSADPTPAERSFRIR